MTDKKTKTLEYVPSEEEKKELKRAIKPKPKQEVAVVSQNTPPESPLSLIQQAIQQGVDPDVMEKLMNLQERWETRQAKKAFDLALAAFQSECPTIQKTKKVPNKDGSIRYQYAPLESIVEQVKGILQKHGFSYTIDAPVTQTSVKAICKVTHDKGHSQESTFEVPIDPEGYMTAPQKVASALTFAKRYAFCNAFGILTGDEDTDANDTGTSAIDPVEVSLNMVKNSKNIAALQDYKNKVMKHPSFTDQQKSRIIDVVDARIEELKNPK